ncbi:MAG: hypothetical protein Kow00105_00210 [Phycisphaeraceae bacterium]
MAGLILTSPGMLWGMALGVLPIVAHWLRRRNVETLVFPSVTLIRSSSAGRIRLFRLWNRLVLVCRLGVVVLICVAFSEPKWVGSSSGTINPSDRHIAMVIDVSASMQQCREGITAWQAIRADLEKVIDDLRPGLDTVSIIVADARARLVSTKPMSNPDRLRNVLDQLHPKPVHADAVSAINLAMDCLSRSTGRAEIVLACDMQAENWSEAVELVTREAVARHIRVVPVGPTFEPPGNLSVHSARVEPRFSLPGEQITLKAIVTNYGPTRRRPTVRITLNERTITSRTVDLNSGDSVEVSFPVRLDDPGTHRVAFVLPDDDLSWDNTAYLAVHVRERPLVGLLTSEDTRDTNHAGYYLARVLQPFANKKYPWELIHIDPTQLTESIIKRVSTLILYRARLDPEQMQILADFIDQGGSIVWFADPDTTARQMSMFNTFLSNSTLSWLPTDYQTRSNVDPLTIVDMDRESNMFSGFTEADRHAYRQYQFESAWVGQTISHHQSSTRLFLIYNNGQPALLAQGIGAGTLYLWNLDIDPNTSNFPKSGGFVALVNRLVELATDTHALKNLATSFDQVLHHLYCPPDQHGPALHVLGPDPEARITSLRHHDKLPPTVSISADSPGFYNVLQGTKKLGIVANNTDPRDSDLHRIDTSLFRQLQKHNTPIVEKETVGSDTADGTHLWLWMVVMAILLMMIEAVLSLRASG